MAEKQSKHHHFVPKALQRSLCFEGERIWYSERGSDDDFAKPWLRNIQSVFATKSYYTALKGDQLSGVVERRYCGVIDDHLGPGGSQRQEGGVRNAIFEMMMENSGLYQ